MGDTEDREGTGADLGMTAEAEGSWSMPEDEDAPENAEACESEAE